VTAAGSGRQPAPTQPGTAGSGRQPAPTQPGTAGSGRQPVPAQPGTAGSGRQPVPAQPGTAGSAPGAHGGRGSGRAATVAAWAGPWPCDERWWDLSAHRRRARLQVTTAGGVAYLLTVESGRWSVEATYD
jgi:protein ImuB